MAAPSFRSYVAIALSLATLSLACNFAIAADEPAQPTVDFKTDIAPILSAHCTKCHGAEKQESGLRLDRRASALRGGDSGVAIVAGKSAESELLHRIKTEDADERMPPADAGRGLTADEIALVTKWIDAGAVWPEEAADAERPVSKHWAYQPIGEAKPPRVKRQGWNRSPIDAFILSRLNAEKIEPSPEASRETLLRRLYLDLTGLLPTPEERAEFLADKSPKAYERLVDRLLASPHFGERWGRHWLDLARYGDSNGYELDIVRPNAWRYRDWVIKSLNDDMPYDRFVVEQLAGDLLATPSHETKLATGFHRMTIKNTESGINSEDYRNREMVDRVNTTGAALMGITLGCAQCHSHKYDPISQQEYYQFYAFFNNIEEVEIDIDGTAAEREAYRQALGVYFEKWLALQARQRMIDELVKRGADSTLKAIESSLQKATKQLQAQRDLKAKGLAAWKKETSADDQRLLQAPAQVTAAISSKKKPKISNDKALERYLASLPVISEKLETRIKTPRGYAELLEESAEVKDALCVLTDERTDEQKKIIEKYYSTLPAKQDEIRDALRLLVTEERYLPDPQILALQEDTESPRETHVLLRGDFKQKGAQVDPATPEVLPALKVRSGNADRLDLAQWLVSAEHPLTARVAVNHVWAHLFGRGIVATVDDFGVQGDRPTHPELLDWLAGEFRRNGWSRKQLIRTIVLSSAYRQTSAHRSDLAERDPLNMLVARQGRFRVEAEIVRDLFLAASGLLDRTLGGATVYPTIPDSVRDIAYKYQLIWPTSAAPDCYRRGMYIHFRRSNPYPSLMVFDAPEGTLCTAARNRSNTPLQALTTLNDPVFLENAQVLGRRVMAEGPKDVEGRAAWLFAACLARSPSEKESAVLVKLFEAERKAYRHDQESAKELTGHVASNADPAEVAAWIATARAVMNLDEFVTRE
jgi:mono/diheme cytochrome c family protein